MLANGHRDVWTYTPRQVAGFVFLLERRHRREAARDLGIAASGARGDPKVVKKMIKDMMG